MKIDLFHNKIIKDTATEQFVSGVESMLLPLIESEYPNATGILFYEDYIADGFFSEGAWYYPLTLRSAEGSETVWISWAFDKKQFASASPYSYVGIEPLSFEIVCDAPCEFKDKMIGRAIDYDESAIVLNVRAATNDVMLLCGKYSQTFVDRLASQITKQLLRALSIDSFNKSTIELELVFAPGTYMEHTSENVTYRRLLMVDGASRPRDFWVKWTRIGGGVAYTVSDAVTDDEIIFELGEDVAHKIREKEYRFLCSTNPNTYQAAMGKKTVTEWRDLIKRAVRRGEITRLKSELEVAERASEVHDKLAEVLSALGQTAPVAEQRSESTAPTDGGFDSLMDLVRAALEKSEGNSDEDALAEMPMIEFDLDGGFAADREDEPIEEGIDESDDNDILEDDEIASDEENESEDEAGEAEQLEDNADQSEDEVDDIDQLDVIEPADEMDDPEVNDEASTEDECFDDVTEEEAEDDSPLEDTVEEAEEENEPVATVDDDQDAPLTIDELLRRLEEAAKTPVDESEEVEDEEEDAPAPETLFKADDIIEESDEEDADASDASALADDVDESDEIDSQASDESDEVKPDEVIAEDEDEVEDIEAEDVDSEPESPIALAQPVIDEESIRREIEARIRLEYEAQARARAEAEIARLIAESNALREENERLAKAARNAEELHRQAVSDHIDATERARATEDMLRAELEAKERREARERDRLAEAARIAVEEQRRREAEMEERYRIEREQREEAERLERERLEIERIAEEERIRAEEAERARIAEEEAARAAEPKYISKRAKIIFRRAADPNVIGRIREIIEETIKANNKQNVRIHMKAYQEDRDVVNLDVLKMPAEEQELLIAIVKAIGNARIGVIKIILE